MIEINNGNLEQPVPKSHIWRIVYLAMVVLAPVIWFFFSFISSKLIPLWQSGDLLIFINLLLFPSTSLPFLPFYAYSTICLALLLYSPNKYASMQLIRFGIYTGTILALQYTVLIVMIYHSFTLALAWTSPFLFVWSDRILRSFLESRLGADVTEKIRFLVVVLIVLVFGIFLGFGIAFSLFFWTFVIMSTISIKLFEKHETRWLFREKLLGITWLMSYIIACYLCFLEMFNLYINLPRSMPPLIGS